MQGDYVSKELRWRVVGFCSFEQLQLHVTKA